MNLVMNILVNGLSYGGMCAMLAVGFALIFGVAKIVNMAHTAFYMVAAFIILACVKTLGLPLWISVVVSIGLTAVLAVICYVLLFDRIKEHETAVLIVSIALALLFQEIFLLLYGAHFNPIPAFVSGSFDLAGVRVDYKHVVAIITCGVTLLLLWSLLNRTKLGNAIRCVAQDREVANLVGINVRLISMLTMGLSAALAAFAAAVVGPIYMVEPFMWMQPLVMVLAAVVLGGLGSIKGAIIAAFLLGFAETMVTFLIPSGSFLRGAVSLAVMVAVLVVRPEGFYGIAFEEERL